MRRIVILAEPDHLGHNLGRLLAADVAGFAAGPAVSALLVGPFGIPAPFLVIAARDGRGPAVRRAHARVDRGAASRRRSASRSTCCASARSPAPSLLGGAVFLMIGTFDALWAVALDDLDTDEWIANLGITLFALPLDLFGAVGGRLAQRVGPFRVGTVGLLARRRVHDRCTALVPTGGAMFAVAMVHSVSDGLTVSSTGVAVGMVVPADRQAGAQGVLGGVQTLVAGVTALVAGALYEHAGRTTPTASRGARWSPSSPAGVALAGLGLAAARRARRSRRAAVVSPRTGDGHGRLSRPAAGPRRRPRAQRVRRTRLVGPLGSSRTASSRRWASSPTRIRHSPARTPSRMIVAAWAADVGALSRKPSAMATISVAEVLVRRRRHVEALGREARRGARPTCVLVELLRVAAEVGAGVEHDRRADVAGHHDGRPQVRRVQAEVGDQRLGEPLHGELRRAVGGVGVVRRATPRSR